MLRNDGDGLRVFSPLPWLIHLFQDVLDVEPGFRRHTPLKSERECEYNGVKQSKRGVKQSMME